MRGLRNFKKFQKILRDLKGLFEGKKRVRKNKFGVFVKDILGFTCISHNIHENQQIEEYLNNFFTY